MLVGTVVAKKGFIDDQIILTQIIYRNNYNHFIIVSSVVSFSSFREIFQQVNNTTPLSVLCFDFELLYLNLQIFSLLIHCLHFFTFKLFIKEAYDVTFVNDVRDFFSFLSNNCKISNYICVRRQCLYKIWILPSVGVILAAQLPLLPGLETLKY